MMFRGQAGDERSEGVIRVVLVDQHAMVRKGLSLILTTEPGIAVVGSAGDGPEAMRLTASLQPNVVILDAEVPQVAEILQHIAADAGAAAVLILSVADDVQQAVALVRAGARGYLCKHATGQDLVAAIRALCRGELALGSTVLATVVDQLILHKPGTVGDMPRELLSERELEVLGLLCQGQTDKQIAQALYLSVRTINSHVSHIYAKLGVGTRTEAMQLALQCGLVTLAPPTFTAGHP